MDTEMKEYRGMEVKVVGRSGPCYVAHVDRTVGITIHDEDDEECWCLNREELLKDAKYSFANRNYHEIFNRTLQGIKNGFVEIFELWYDDGLVCWYDHEVSGSSHFTCAYK